MLMILLYFFSMLSSSKLRLHVHHIEPHVITPLQPSLSYNIQVLIFILHVLILFEMSKLLHTTCYFVCEL